MFGIIETMVFHLSTPRVLLGPWFSVYPPCEYYSDCGFPKSTVIAAIQPMASIRQERVLQNQSEFFSKKTHFFIFTKINLVHLLCYL